MYRESGLGCDLIIECKSGHARGDNVRQARAVLDHVTETVTALGSDRPQPEGSPDAGWVLLDVGEGVIVHVFSLEARARYDLEGLWSRAQEVVRIQ